MYPETADAGIAVQLAENPVVDGVPVRAKPVGTGGAFCICRAVDAEDVSVVPPLLYSVSTMTDIGLLKVNENVIDAGFVVEFPVCVPVPCVIVHL